jgi:hypothetical protein
VASMPCSNLSMVAQNFHIASCLVTLPGLPLPGEQGLYPQPCTLDPSWSASRACLSAHMPISSSVQSLTIPQTIHTVSDCLSIWFLPLGKFLVF